MFAKLDFFLSTEINLVFLLGVRETVRDQASDE